MTETYTSMKPTTTDEAPTSELYVELFDLQFKEFADSISLRPSMHDRLYAWIFQGMSNMGYAAKNMLDTDELRQRYAELAQELSDMILSDYNSWVVRVWGDPIRHTPGAPSTMRVESICQRIRHLPERP